MKVREWKIFDAGPLLCALWGRVDNGWLPFARKTSGRWVRIPLGKCPLARIHQGDGYYRDTTEEEAAMILFQTEPL